MAHNFGIGGWPPSEVQKLPEIEIREDGYKHQHTIYLWRIEEGLGPPQ